MQVEGYIKKKQIESNEAPVDSTQKLDRSYDFASIRIELVDIVREKIIEKYSVEDLKDTSKMELISKESLNMIEEETANIPGGMYLDANEKNLVLEKLLQNMFGFGVLDPLIKDPSITEIMVNGLDNIFVEKEGRIVIASDAKGDNLRFDTQEELMFIIDKIVAPINRKIDDSNPIVDARLPNGFRVNVVLNVISLDGTIITIRKFPENPFTMDKLVSKNALTKEAADFLEKLTKARYNIFISGSTGSGKTTFLNALSNFINKDERVITIEDAAELKIAGIKNLIRLETRPPNVEGKGQISMRDLLKTALRMRPDRIVVGEVRTGEALEMLQAMNTGHDGSLSTGHANTALDMLARLETMVMMSGMELPLLSIRQQIATAIEVVVHLGKIRDGSRKVLQIIEILGINSDGNYLTQELFKYDIEKNKLLYTGNKLSKTEKLRFMINQKNDSGELGRAIITTNFNLPHEENIRVDDSGRELTEKTGLFERFLQTKSSKNIHRKVANTLTEASYNDENIPQITALETKEYELNTLVFEKIEENDTDTICEIDYLGRNISINGENTPQSSQQEDERLVCFDESPTSQSSKPEDTVDSMVDDTSQSDEQQYTASSSYITTGQNSQVDEASISYINRELISTNSPLKLSLRRLSHNENTLVEPEKNYDKKTKHTFNIRKLLK